MSTTQQARVMAVFGRQYLVELEGGQEKALAALGRKSDIAVGDIVSVRDADTSNAVIASVQTRRNVYLRSDAFKSKQLAANLHQVLCVVAGEPLFNEEHLLRASVAAAHADVDFVIVHNKHDLSANAELMKERLDVWRGLGYAVQTVSAKQQAASTLEALSPLLMGKVSLMIGQSGMGKSTLLNLLVPQAQQRTQEISRVLNSGKQTTTFTQAFRLPEGDGLLIDSPGFSEFGLAHLSESQIQHAMPEIKVRLGTCRFHNCRHEKEPGCSVLDAVSNGHMDALRHAMFLKLG